MLEKTVRTPIEAEGKKKWSDNIEAMEFVFPKKYSKTLRPIFTQDLVWVAKEENGPITIIFTPRLPSTTSERSFLDSLKAVFSQPLVP